MLSELVRTTVAQHGPKSLVILADYQGAEIDHKVATRIKEVIALDRPFVKRAAWVGTAHIPHALIESVPKVLILRGPELMSEPPEAGSSELRHNAH